MLTALDILKLNAGALAPLVEEVAVVAPELAIIPAEVIAGTTLEVSVRTGLPTVAFRNANEGITRTKSTFENRIFQTHILDSQVAVDLAILKGAAKPEKVMEDEVYGVLQAVLKKFGDQFYYGNPSASDKGFPGLIAQAASDAAHNVDAAGSTAKSSVWALCMDRDGAKVIFGNNEAIGMGSEWRKETVLDGASKPFTAMVNDLTGRVGLSLKNKNRAFRIKNIGTDTGKGLTDALLAELIQVATEGGATVTHLLMNPRSRAQLQKSRQAVSTAALVPLPREYEGIPFVITNSITNAE